MKVIQQIFTAALSLFALTAAAQQGSFKAYSYDGFRLHVYSSNDVMADASYIVEGKEGVVTLEEPLFKENAEEFTHYLKGLGKPVEARIVDYHEGATGHEAIIMAEGMSKFTKEGVYDQMMKGFQKNFGEAMVERPTGKATEVSFGKSITLAGVEFRFEKGASTDFPAAAILIGNKAILNHWAPTFTHVNALYISSPAAVDARIEEVKQALDSGAELFLGSHGGVVKKEEAAARLKYLQNIRQLLKDKTDAASFAAALKKAYPELTDNGEVEALAKALYAQQ